MKEVSISFKNPNTNPRNPNGSISFKDALNGNYATPIDQIQKISGAYIVDQMDKVPTMDITILEIKSLFVDL